MHSELSEDGQVMTRLSGSVAEISSAFLKDRVQDVMLTECRTYIEHARQVQHRLESRRAAVETAIERAEQLLSVTQTTTRPCPSSTTS